MSKRDFATADCETDPFKFNREPKPFVWGFYHPKTGFRHFFKTEDFVDFIKDKKIILYFHNGGKFDVHFLLPFIAPQNNIMIVDGRICKIKLGECEIRDSWLNFPDKLSAYKKDDIDYKKMEKKRRNKNMPEILKYLEGDCFYLYELLEENFNSYGQKISLAATAFDFWHKKFLKDVKPSTSKSFFDDFKKYYYGGRCQFFKQGLVKKEFKMYDINSAYADAMKEDHPYGTEYEESTRIIEGVLEKSFIHLRGRSFGALPFRDAGLSFPCDADLRDFYCSGREIKTGLETGTLEIDKVYSVKIFRSTINFSDYIDYFYNKKAEMKGVSETQYILAKKYLVTLYGKYGMNPEDHKEYILAEQKYILAHEKYGYEFESIMGKYALLGRPVNDTKKKYYNVATAASITAFVRAYLFETMLGCEDVLYCDTDSIVCSEFSGKLGKNLGEWSEEGIFKSGAIAGKKMYAFEYKKPPTKNNKKVTHKISSKGVKLNAKQIYSIAEGAVVRYKNKAPTLKIVGDPISFLVRDVRGTGKASILKKGKN